eukprot:TRINITY_DN27136_c0_g1_i1.p1 TRINITY_DN27136_c0_g1~~TRINITY_DN27136_c0_g1_i1.p1  ORF type:complete len:727 (-),score=128.15 TRINITY_DN27136_c0_g1_i1:99-2279(-)
MVASDARSELHAVYALAQVLLQTISALGLGFLSVGFGFVDEKRGDLQGMHFFIGRIALPLIVFRIIATGHLADVHFGVIAACNLGKVTVLLLTFFATYLGYRTRNSVGDRILTASVFGFFTTASNDLAIGFPVVHAVYGEEMVVYIAANVLIFQTVIQPAVMIAFEIGEAVRAQSLQSTIPSSVSLSSLTPTTMGAMRSQRSWWMLLRRIAKAIAFNPILIATAAGSVYAALWGSHLQTSADGRRSLPNPLEGILTLWTSPFTMMFLFLNGASLKNARLALWPAALVLMKVVACSYISYGLSYVLVGDSSDNAQQLRDFVFFYGTIPAGGAPLIYAQVFDCGADVIASASLFCLVLAGPIELTTTLYLGTVSGKVNYQDVHMVLREAARVGVSCSGLFIMVIAIGWWGGSFASRAVGVYGVVSFLFEVWTIFMLRELSWTCSSPTVLFVFRFLQNYCYFLVIYIEYHLGRRSRGGWRERVALMLPVVAALAVVPTWLQTYNNTFHELCGLEPTGAQATSLVAWNVGLLVLILTLAIRARIRKRRGLPKNDSLLVPLFPVAPGDGDLDDHVIQRRVAVDAPLTGESARTPSLELRSSPASDGGGAAVDCDGVGVATTLVVVQTVRCLMDIINSVGTLRSHSGSFGFEPMIIMSTCLEHGQGCIVLLAVLLQPRSLARLRTLLERLGALLGWTTEVAVFDPMSPVGSSVDVMRRIRTSCDDLSNLAAR